MSLGNLIDGRAIAKEVHAETNSRVVALKAGGVVPSLMFIRGRGGPCVQSLCRNERA